MKLYLMQHGHAQTSEVDPQRALSEQGMIDVEKIARVLKAGNIRVARVIHSGKLRAQQTAEVLASHISDGVIDAVDGLKPNDEVSVIADEIDNLEQDLCLVGHLPFMSALVSFLVTDETDKTIVSFTPGSMICLQRDESEQWLINWMIRPELITNA